MLKKVVYILPFLFSLTSNANYHNGAFVSLYTGFDFNAKIQSTINNEVYDDKYEVSPLVRGVVGYDYNDLSFYISYDRRSFDSTEQGEYGNKLNIGIALVNIAYNFHVVNPSFVQYVSFGVGIAQSQIKFDNVLTLNGHTSDTQDIENAFTYQVKGGARLFLTQSLAVFADARFTSIQPTDYTTNQLFASGSTVRMQFFSVNGGLSYFF